MLTCAGGLGLAENGRTVGGAGSETEGFVLAELAKTDIGPGPGDGVVPELVK